MNKKKRRLRAVSKSKENRRQHKKMPSGIKLHGGFRSVGSAITSTINLNPDIIKLKKTASGNGVLALIAKNQLKKVEKQVKEITQAVENGQSINDLMKEIENKTGYKVANFVKHLIHKNKR